MFGRRTACIDTTLLLWRFGHLPYPGTLRVIAWWAHIDPPVVNCGNQYFAVKNSYTSPIDQWWVNSKPCNWLVYSLFSEQWSRWLLRVSSGWSACSVAFETAQWCPEPWKCAAKSTRFIPGVIKRGKQGNPWTKLRSIDGKSVYNGWISQCHVWLFEDIPF